MLAKQACELNDSTVSQFEYHSGKRYMRQSQLRTFEHQVRPNGGAHGFSWCTSDEGGGGGVVCLHIGMARDILHCISIHAHF